MRHINDDDLGFGHTVIKINKRCMSSLNDNDIKSELTNLCPDYIYVHLGINDLHQGAHPKDIMTHLINFHRLTQTLNTTKVIFSLPLLNGRLPDYHNINLLRKMIANYIRDSIQANHTNKTTLFLNWNDNFFESDDDFAQRKYLFNYYKNDPLHLSHKGKTTILANLRHVIHHLTKESRATSTPFNPRQSPRPI